MKTKGKISTILILIATVVLAGVAIFTAFRLYKLRQEAVAPTAPVSKPKAATCIEQCPGSDGILRNCHPPDSDGTSQDSICSSAGRVEMCGDKKFCCPSANGKWTLDMTQCSQPVSCTALSFAISTPTPTPTPTPGPANSCGGTCGSDNNCASGFYCNNGYCRNPNCPSDTDCNCATPTPTSTSVATSTPRTYTATPTPTGEPALPTAGTSWPTVLGVSTGIILLIGSLLLML